MDVPDVVRLMVDLRCLLGGITRAGRRRHWWVALRSATAQRDSAKMFAEITAATSTREDQGPALWAKGPWSVVTSARGSGSRQVRRLATPGENHGAGTGEDEETAADGEARALKARAAELATCAGP